MADRILERIYSCFPVLANLGTEFEKIRLISQKIPGGTQLALEGDQCQYLALFLAGSAKVYKIGENGREITLYHINAGECCVLTASCMLNGNGFHAQAVAKSDIEVLMLPSAVFRTWMKESEGWRSFIFDLFSRRLDSLVHVVDEVAFQRLDCRIAEYLISIDLDLTGIVKLTHQDIASELGTSREVVSRILKMFEQCGVLQLKRGVIKIINSQQLTGWNDQKKW